jgi:aminomethyltransferase
MCAMLAADVADAARLRVALRRRGLEIATARAIQLFGTDSPPGAETSFTAAEGGYLLVAAPGGPMSPWEQAPPTDLLLFGRRATPAALADELLPEPLADPRFELRVQPASAEPYLVRAGEFIQIIDVRDRQCSDFVAYDRTPLDRGVVRGIDNVTTRTLTGSAYPRPGLFSKFFDADMNPLVEVVQDTVGRHDSFNLACTARYYEDQGYFGHVNCSDNFTDRLTAHGLPAQKGRPAINLFFNTVVGAQNAIHFDEPWSRPGDYVLLRAMTDLAAPPRPARATSTPPTGGS